MAATGGPDMTRSSARIRAVVLLLTALTGFAGLAYEVAWQRYLATLLGAQSEATAAVLAIFLGGLSAGYWLFGAVTRRLVARARAGGRPPPLLRVYGGVEAAIGVYALLFPWLFRAAQQISLWLPTGGGLVAFAADVALAAALIGPPAVLMGGTIPILTQVLARSVADAPRVHALIYASNTAGAFAGALAAGFSLVPWLGLDSLAQSMGVINLGAGATFAWLGRRGGEVVALEVGGGPARSVSGASAYAAAALLIGFASMTCQTVLIRIGGLALGSSEFTFAMVVAAFVLAIAVGSLVVSALPRIGRAVLPASLWALVLAFALLYTRIDEASYWGHVLRTHFASRPESFRLYYGAAFLATLALIGPGVALSGAALPLLFEAVREGFGDLGSRAGRLYSQNTIGSLLGALGGGYALLFWLDLHHVFRIALGAYALAAAFVTAQRYFAGSLTATAAMSLPALFALAWLSPWDPAQLSAGHFRERERTAWTSLGPDYAPRTKVLFHDDDPTSTVIAAQGSSGSVSILVNGKSDGNTKADRNTMALAALIPALLAREPTRAFVIGFGTGITAGSLAGLDEMQAVTVVEISSGVLRAAPFFDFANNGASKHPKITRVRSDAYRALLRSQERFDVIVSEPSNPWVAGVEMLFSREFLRAARDRLAPGGAYVQWFHTYETNNRAVQLVLQTFTEVFGHVSAWRSQSTDVLLVGMRDGPDELDLGRLEQRFARPDFRAPLEQIGIRALPELLVHESVPIGVLNENRLAGAAEHSLFHPRLSYEAGRAFFVGKGARLPFLAYGRALLDGPERSLLRRYLSRFEGGEIPQTVWDEMVSRACAFRLPHCPTLVAAWAVRHPEPGAVAQIIEWRGRSKLDFGPELIGLLRFFYGGDAPDAIDGSPAQITSKMSVFLDQYYFAMPFAQNAIVALWQHCRDPGALGTCDTGLRAAEEYAETGQLPAAWRDGYQRAAR
jgi:spermidine synthase